jgi:alkaline phosphatase D
MLKILYAILLLITSLAHAQNNHQRLKSIQQLKHFAFGSCNYHQAHQYIWPVLTQQKPQLWIWGGDAVYGDWNKNSEELRQSFATQNSHPDYQAFKQQVPILGTWDDHDFAYDEANGHYEAKPESQKMFLDFMEEPQHSPRRKQAGIFTSYDFGPAGQRVKMILLDNRYFKDLEADAAILGKTQWEWLEKELKHSQADVHFIVSGLSVLSPLMPYTEQWADYPGEYEHMLQLLNTYKPKGLVFLSGDKHFSSIWKRHGHLEFMASGMTHVAPRITWWYLSRRYPITFFGINYGHVEIEWKGKTPRLITSIRNWSGQDIFTKSFDWENGSWMQKWSFQIGADQHIEDGIELDERAP